MHRVLLVEDEEHLQEIIKLNLEIEGLEVDVAGNGKTAIEKFKQKPYHLIILDIMIPEISGYDVCQTIRLENQDVPILILSAKSNSSDRIQGLRYGADDYLTKPFNLEELLLRVNILISRSLKTNSTIQQNEFVFGNNKINFATFKVKGVNIGNKLLTSREIKILKLLIDKRNQVVSREEIIEKIWGYDAFPTTRTIDNFILAFRKYFELDTKNPSYFLSIRGVGYKFHFEG